jgi:hypothetical protein
MYFDAYMSVGQELGDVWCAVYGRTVRCGVALKWKSVGGGC